jgi:hypothetical protein
MPVNVTCTLMFPVDGGNKQVGKLRAVLLHHPDEENPTSVRTGHYTAMVQRWVRNSNEWKWYHMNDDNVQEVVDIEEMLKKPDIQTKIHSCLYQIQIEDNCSPSVPLTRIRGGGTSSPDVGAAPNKCDEENEDGTGHREEEVQWHMNDSIYYKQKDNQLPAWVVTEPRIGKDGERAFIIKYNTSHCNDITKKVLCKDCTHRLVVDKKPFGKEEEDVDKEKEENDDDDDNDDEDDDNDDEEEEEEDEEEEEEDEEEEEEEEEEELENFEYDYDEEEEEEVVPTERRRSPRIKRHTHRSSKHKQKSALVAEKRSNTSSSRSTRRSEKARTRSTKFTQGRQKSETGDQDSSSSSSLSDTDRPTNGMTPDFLPSLIHSRSDATLSKKTQGEDQEVDEQDRELQESDDDSSRSNTKEDSSGDEDEDTMEDSSGDEDEDEDEDKDHVPRRELPMPRKVSKRSVDTTQAMNLVVPKVQRYQEFSNGRTTSYHAPNPLIRIQHKDDGTTSFDFPNQPSGVVGIVTYTPDCKMAQARFAQVEEKSLHNLTGATQQLLFGPLDNPVDSQFWIRELMNKIPSMEKLYSHQCDVFGRPFQQRTEYKCLRKPQQPPPPHFEPFRPTSIVVPIHKREMNNWLLERMKGSYAFYFCLRDRVNSCRDANTDKMNPAKMQSLITDLRSLEASAKAAVVLGADLVRSQASRESYLFKNPVKRIYVSNDTYDTRFFAERHVKRHTSDAAVNFGIMFGVPAQGVVSCEPSYKTWTTSSNHKRYGAFRSQVGVPNEWTHLPDLPPIPKHLAPLLPKYQNEVGILLTEFLKNASKRLNIVLPRHPLPGHHLSLVLTKISELENAKDFEEAFLVCIQNIFEILIDGQYEELWEHIRYILPVIYSLVEAECPNPVDVTLETLREVINSPNRKETMKTKGYRIHVSLGNDKAINELQSQRGNSIRSSYFKDDDCKYHASVLNNTFHTRCCSTTSNADTCIYIPLLITKNTQMKLNQINTTYATACLGHLTATATGWKLRQISIITFSYQLPGAIIR